MTSLKRCCVATLLAFALALVPASISPTGGLELESLCASGDCVRSPGNICWDDDLLLFGYKNVP